MACGGGDGGGSYLNDLFKTYSVILLNDGTSWTMRVKQAIPNFKTVCVLHSMLAGL